MHDIWGASHQITLQTQSHQVFHLRFQYNVEGNMVILEHNAPPHGFRKRYF